MTQTIPHVDYLFKVLLIGNSGVGKSSILSRYADNYFEEQNMPTIGVDFKINQTEIDGKVVKLQIWDTAGQCRFKTITQSYYRGSHGIIVVFDVTDRESFSGVQRWMQQVEENCQNVSCILVGNKSDLTSKRAVTFDEGQELADHFMIRYVETSAKESKNVDSAFTMMTREIKNRVAIA